MDVLTLFDYGLEKELVLLKQIADYTTADIKKHSKTLEQVELAAVIGLLHAHVNRLPSPGGSLTCHDRILLCNLRNIMDGFSVVFKQRMVQIFSKYEYLVKIKDIHKEKSIIPRPVSFSGKKHKKTIKETKKQWNVDETPKVSLKDDVLLKAPKDKSFYMQEVDFDGAKQYLNELLEISHRNSSIRLDKIRETPQIHEVPKISEPHFQESHIQNVQTLHDMTVGDISKLIPERKMKTISYNLSGIVEIQADKSRKKSVDIYKNIYRVNTKFDKNFLTRPAELMDPVVVYCDVNKEDNMMSLVANETSIDFNFLTDNDELIDIVQYSHPRGMDFEEESSNVQLDGAYLMESTVEDLTVKEKENVIRPIPAISPCLLTPNIVIEETHSEMTDMVMLQERLEVLLIKKNGNVTFSEICPPDKTSKLIAAKTFKNLMDH
ncbi:uncharacterized protein LOC106672408 isoform X2 [Cimex lectularius]|uniref:Uncharacterized protein n=1 Tax=Cimex lectularius TaxID=79782 RepID=A0A8I6SUF8_CIMLE|nr:uncharacterized protein LOC106672408 isoform X2 [Cimex lectularius]